MKIQNTERTVGKSENSVTISSNPKREREFLDKNGNVINPRTKQIIKRAEQ
jgi:hypothetical protein